LVSDTLVVDFNVAIHDHIRARGARVVYGDIANPATLQGAKLTDAHVIVCTIPDDILKGINNLELTRQLRKIAPNAKIIANAVQLRDIPKIYAVGADYVFSWRTETSLGVVPALCAALNGNIEGFVGARRNEFGDLLARKAVLD